MITNKYTKFGFFLYLLLWFNSAIAQDKLIKGQVLSDASQQPVSGVTIRTVFGNQVTYSNEKGFFSLPWAGQADTLVLNHKGYQSYSIALPTTGLTATIFYLHETAKDLAEVMIHTGIQTLPRERATGSFTQISQERFNEQVGSNVFNRLGTITNGVVPISSRIGTSTAAGNLLIRGWSTLTWAIQKPLIILDNFEYQGDLDNINPNTVETITVLKDAAASSIWGAKAANGVIVITSKKSEFRKKTTITGGSNITIVSKPDLFYQPRIPSNEIIELEKYLFSQKYRFSDTANSARVPLTPVYETLFNLRDGKVSAADADAYFERLSRIDIRDEFTRHFYHQATNQQYHLQINGGSEKISWLLSGAYDYNSGTLQDPYKRVHAKTNTTYQLTKKLSLQVDAQFTNSVYQTGNPAYGQINAYRGNTPIYSQLATDDGMAVPWFSKYRQRYIDTAGRGLLLNWYYYPLTDHHYVNNNTKLQNIFTTWSADYRLSSSFSLDVKYRIEHQQTTNLVQQSEGSFYTRDLINIYAQPNFATNTIKYNVPRGSILDRRNNTLTAQQLRGQLNYKKQWGAHTIHALTAAEVGATKVSENAYRIYGYQSEILSFVNVDYANLYRQYVTGGQSFIPNNQLLNRTDIRFVSFFNNAAYSFRNTYTLSVSFRRDASNLFGVNTNDKWKPLWSTGFSWDILRESFLSLPGLSTLKARITYGQQGNLDPTRVAVTTINYGQTNPYTFTPTAQVANFVNPDLKWEQVATTNVGIDFATKNRRLSGSLEFFKKSISDLYSPSPIDPTTGIGTTIIKNVGKMKGHGFDIILQALVVDQPVSWRTELIVNTYKDKITKLNPIPSTVGNIVGMGLMRWEGYSPFGYFAYRYAGLDPQTGDPLGYLKGEPSNNWISITGNGSTLADLRYVGRLLPSLYGSMGNTISWRQLTLTARVSYKFGYYFKRESINYNTLITALEGHEDYLKRWQKPGDEVNTQVPSFVYPLNSTRNNFYNNSEALATKGDHVRLEYINLSYQLREKDFRSKMLQSLRLFVVANNLGIIWRANKEKIDPDHPQIVPPRNLSIGMQFIL